LKTIASIMLVALMMLLTAMAVNAEEPASEAVTTSVTVAEEKVNESATEAKEKVEEAATKAEELVNESATEAKEKVEEAATKAEEKVNETAPKEAKEQPGFEGIFAIAGLLAVASLVLSRRE
jgi:F0F1-type ATP synthase membrane subunit b/b'